MIVSFFESMRNSHATRKEMAWEDFCAWHASPRIHDGEKHALPLSAPVAFRNDHRSKADAELVYALTFDVDVPPACSPRRLALVVAGVSANISTSFRHTVAEPRCRLHVLPSRPLVGAAEQEIVWRFVAETLQAHGVGVGKEAKDCSRASFVPARRTGAPYEHHVTHGVPLDVDGVLFAERERIAREETERESRRVQLEAEARRRGVSSDDMTLERAVANVRASNARHTEINRWTWILAKLTSLADHEIQDAMQRAGESTGLDAREVARTVRCAMRSAGRVST